MPPALKLKTQRQQGRKEGGCAAATMLKVAWLMTLAMFLASVGVTMNMATNDESAPSYREEQLVGGPRKRRADRRAQRIIATKANEPDPASRNRHHNSSKRSISSTDEEDILKWLRQRKNNNTANHDSDGLAQLLSSPLYFAAGSLPLSQLSTLKRCYADPAIYRDHFKERVTRRIPYSEELDLAYVLLPKSGSSTGRFMMQREFDAVERPVKVELPMNVIAFVRDPLSRFYSQYDEAYVRTAPWHRIQNPYYVGDNGENDNKSKGRRIKGGLTHPFPYLFDNLHSYHDYQDVFCPKHTRTNPMNYRECTFAESKENGTLASRLERFVFDYDGRSPFDIHLALQVPMLSDVRNGRAIHLTELYNTTDAGREWNAIVKRYLGAEASLHHSKEEETARSKSKEGHGGVIRGRSYPRRLDVRLVGREAERRIAELALLDYCCLNFPLPKRITSGEEKGDGDRDDGGKNLTCKMDYDEGRVRIQPGVFPDAATK